MLAAGLADGTVAVYNMQENKKDPSPADSTGTIR